MPSIIDVQKFWDDQPLFTGEASAPVCSREFFDEHRRVVVEDGFLGTINPKVFPDSTPTQDILDVGCGIGFWLVEFWRSGARNIWGVDLSPRSVEIARCRCDLFEVKATVQVGNAEQLPFGSASFTHVNCAGVIHHTPNPEKAISEIARVLKPGGTASVSVYYKNIALRSWPFVQPVMRTVPIKLVGRGREGMIANSDMSEIVRLYDGADNPLGQCYSQAEFRKLLHPLQVEEIFFQYFPARSLPFRVPTSVHRMLEWATPFLIWAKLRKQ